MHIMVTLHGPRFNNSATNTNHCTDNEQSLRILVVTCSYLHIKYEKTDNIRITLSAILVTILLVFINLIVNHFFHYSISLIYAFTGIVLTGNALSFYVGWLLWLQEKKKLKHPEKTLYL